MQRIRKMSLVLSSTVAVYFVIVSLVQADPLTTSQAINNLNNAKKAVSIPVWKITQDGTNSSVNWVDATNSRFAIYDVEGDNAGGSQYYSDDLVLDKETGLVWARDANLGGVGSTWQAAIDYCLDLALGNRKGWRLPTAEELSSLVDPSNYDPPLPSGHPFINVQSDTYWSSTTYESTSSHAHSVSMVDGLENANAKGLYLDVWPVRGGNGYATGSWM